MERINKKEFLLKKLKSWFEENKRNFPWRKNPTPYAVWVSEVMLQQTQASVVVPYFYRWMERFPTIEALSKSSIEEVIKIWEGLGYYSRARNLHEGARFLMKHFKGKLPLRREDLQKVKGLGPYTIGAILSFAFHQKAPAIDGNVIRVISRLFCIEGEIERLEIQKKIRDRVEHLLPDSEPWVIMEALIELGALVCSRKAECNKCPLVEECLAYRLGKVDELPQKKKRSKVILLHREVLVIYHGEDFLVQKREGKQLMAGLYEFPYVEKKESSSICHFGKLQFYQRLRNTSHTFTRYKAELFPALWKAAEKRKIDGHDWVPGKKLTELPFSSGHRKILTQLLEDYADLTH